jgi:hypothetical protein
MSLFRYTREEYDKMFIRLPDVDVQDFRNHLHGYNMIFDYVNRDFMMYSRNDVIKMIRFKYFKYFEGTQIIRK